jgi:hypothetical protein
LKLRVFLSFPFLAAWIAFGAEPPAQPPEVIVEHYQAASQNQEKLIKGSSVDVDIAATLPKLKKQGRLLGLRRISDLGRITYEALRFEGDNTVKNQVIARYLSAEVEAQKEQPSLAVTPENYQFKYKGRTQWNGQSVHVFQLNPRHKRVGLFKGELWIDDATNLRVRETGKFVKKPSFMVKSVAFVRDYVIRDGISVPRQVHSVVDTRLVGKAELTIDYTNFTVEKQPATPGNDGQ